MYINANSDSSVTKRFQIDLNVQDEMPVLNTIAKFASSYFYLQLRTPEARSKQNGLPPGVSFAPLGELGPQG
jgi:hypothetical protein